MCFYPLYILVSQKIIFLFNYFEFFLLILIELPWIRIQISVLDPDPHKDMPPGSGSE